jgi:hypothetical protein
VRSDNNGHTPRLRARGGIWEEKNAKTKDKVKLKVKVKAKVDRSIHPPRDHALTPHQLSFLFLSGRRGSVGMRGKNVARSENV